MKVLTEIDHDSWGWADPVEPSAGHFNDVSGASLESWTLLERWACCDLALDQVEGAIFDWDYVVLNRMTGGRPWESKGSVNPTRYSYIAGGIRVWNSTTAE